MDYDGTGYNSRAEYKCNEGFLLDGSPTMICESDGQTKKWTAMGDADSAPSCKRMLLFDVYCIMVVSFPGYCPVSHCLQYKKVGSACYILLSDAGWRNSRKTLVCGFARAQRTKCTYLDSTTLLAKQ